MPRSSRVLASQMSLVSQQTGNEPLAISLSSANSSDNKQQNAASCLCSSDQEDDINQKCVATRNVKYAHVSACSV